MGAHHSELKLVNHSKDCLPITESAPILFNLAETVGKGRRERFFVPVLKVFPGFPNFRLKNGLIRGGCGRLRDCDGQQKQACNRDKTRFHCGVQNAELNDRGN